MRFGQLSECKGTSLAATEVAHNPHMTAEPKHFRLVLKNKTDLATHCGSI